MYKDNTIFGIMLISGSTTHCYKVIKSGTYTDIQFINHKNVRLQKRQRKGGQSSQRIGRIRQIY
jgi:peptide subunit release factor 1 (eRF1)